MKSSAFVFVHVRPASAVRYTSPPMIAPSRFIASAKDGNWITRVFGWAGTRAGALGPGRLPIVPLIVPITLLNHYVRKYDEPYLKQQLYLNPHPLALKLRNHA